MRISDWSSDVCSSDLESEQRRQRLGAFLKAHRIRLVPQEVGLSATGRRRTPGLRREEVAQLAGISATWYVRIEQGREVAASARTEQRRGGTEVGSTCRSRWAPVHKKKKTKKE